MGSYIVNLPKLPSELLDSCALAKSYWAWLAFVGSDDNIYQRACLPTETGRIDGICAVGAVMRAFGWELESAGFTGGSGDTEACDFINALAWQLDEDEVRDHLDYDAKELSDYSMLVVMNWSDSREVRKSDVVLALEGVERTLGYSV